MSMLAIEREAWLPIGMGPLCNNLSRPSCGISCLQCLLNFACPKFAGICGFGGRGGRLNIPGLFYSFQYNLKVVEGRKNWYVWRVAFVLAPQVAVVEAPALLIYAVRLRRMKWLSAIASLIYGDCFEIKGVECKGILSGACSALSFQRAYI